MGASAKSLAGTLARPFAVLGLAAWLGGCAVGSFDLGRGRSTASAPPGPAPMTGSAAEPNPWNLYSAASARGAPHRKPHRPRRQQATQGRTWPSRHLPTATCSATDATAVACRPRRADTRRAGARRGSRGRRDDDAARARAMLDGVRKHEIRAQPRPESEIRREVRQRQDARRGAIALPHPYALARFAVARSPPCDARPAANVQRYGNVVS